MPDPSAAAGTQPERYEGPGGTGALVLLNCFRQRYPNSPRDVSQLKSDPMTNGRSLDIEMTHIVPAAVPLDPMESRTVFAGAETGLAGMARPAERSTSRDDGTVPVKQLLRWQDDGGAIPPDG